MRSRLQVLFATQDLYDGTYVAGNLFDDFVGYMRKRIATFNRTARGLYSLNRFDRVGVTRRAASYLFYSLDG